MLLSQADLWSRLLHDGENVAINVVQHGADFELKVRHVESDVEKTYTDVRELLSDLAADFVGAATDKPAPMTGAQAPVPPSNPVSVGDHLQANLDALKVSNPSGVV